jgi:hypothetical protein
MAATVDIAMWKNIMKFENEEVSKKEQKVSLLGEMTRIGNV